MKTTINVYPENKCTELETVIKIPFCNKNGSDFDLDKCKRQESYLYDLIGTFSERIISSLKRRMRACQENLINHLDDIEYSDECGHIVYVRKDGSRGTFNVPSFKVMQKAVELLEKSNQKEFCSNPMMIDQTLKALLNDTFVDRCDCGTFKYSELVSALCELHYFKMQVFEG